jgi:hypothetical protein
MTPAELARRLRELYQERERLLRELPGTTRRWVRMARGSPLPTGGRTLPKPPDRCPHPYVSRTRRDAEGCEYCRKVAEGLMDPPPSENQQFRRNRR